MRTDLHKKYAVPSSDQNQTKTEQTMKKSLIFHIILQTAAAVIFIAFLLIFTRHVSYSELHTVQRLAGGVISSFPEAEPAFLDALQDHGEDSRVAGELLLARYGYSEDAYFRLYLQNTAVFFSVFFILFIAASSVSLLPFYHWKKQQKAQEDRLLSLLERCLDDDYSFLEQRETLFPDRQDIFADTFVQLAQKLRLKTEALAEEKDHTKTLVTDISHQIKTPLSALKTCFSLYLEADTPAESEEFLTRCRFQLEKLETLTASLLNISRLETAMIRPKPERTSLTEILVKAVNGVYDKAAAKQISIETESFPDITLFLDEKWTAEALFNLLDNAVKYSPAGSFVRVRIQKLCSFVRLEIEDQGIGIPKEEYNQIFRRFYRGRSRIVRQSEGSGVGLYLAQKILEDQGCTLSVKAAAVQGSIFVVQLPL